MGALFSVISCLAALVFLVGSATGSVAHAQSPTDAVDCGNGMYCPSGNACLQGGQCAPKIGVIPGSTRTSTGSYCAPGLRENRFYPGACLPHDSQECAGLDPNGRRYTCPAGTRCSSNNTGCVAGDRPFSGPTCGTVRCVDSRRICASSGQCMDTAYFQDCGNGVICSRSAACAFPSGCVAVSTLRSQQVAIAGSGRPSGGLQPAAADHVIAAIQVLLAALGFDPGSPDGVNGPQTAKAIAAYQASIGDKPDGQPSETLRAKLQKDVAERKSGASATSSRRPREVAGSGSGFFISADIVVTNQHVIDGCSEIRMRRSGADIGRLRVVAASKGDDLAALKSEKTWDNYLELRVGVPLRPAESVVVFGYPLSGALSSAGNTTLGNITALTGLRDDSRYIQISAAVQPGNSGGPVLDESGRLIGVVQGKLDALKVVRATGDIPQNVNFAIRSSTLANFLEANQISYSTARGGDVLGNTKVAERAAAASLHVQCLK
jgi:S1-C subfamily serine protease